MLCGKHLIDWSLDHLFDSDQIDAVVVSTDDEAMYVHAVKRGALDIGLRPAHLATDAAPNGACGSMRCKLLKGVGR